MSHVVLLGDSIFDNDAYVGGGPAVIDHLKKQLPPGWQATLLARDGGVISGIQRQLEQLPASATHLVISVGGNNALGESGILGDAAKSVAEVLLRLADIAAEFEKDYQGMLKVVQNHKLATALCTIYYPAFPDPKTQRLAVTGSTVFNDCIIRAAFGAGLPLIDLRLVCNERSDYANAIEPSVTGGAKIAGAVTRLITQHNFNQRRTAVFV